MSAKKMPTASVRGSPLAPGALDLLSLVIRSSALFDIRRSVIHSLHSSPRFRHGPDGFSSDQRAMDEPCARFVHGGDQRCRRLETAPCHRNFCRSGLWRISRARMHLLRAYCNRHRGTGHEWLEIGARPATTQTCHVGANGAAGKGAPRIYVDFQETRCATLG